MAAVDSRGRPARPALRFGVLGSLQVLGSEGEIVIASEKQRRLLATLLVDARRVVSVDRLLDTLWDGEPPASAEKTLRTYVARLRRALGSGAGEGGVLDTRPPGYVLELDVDQVDAERFERLVDAATDVAADDPRRGVELLDSALGLWRGDALAEFRTLDFARPEAERLDELRLAAQEARFDAELGLGRHHVLIGQLEAFAGTHPYREKPLAQLMVALYRAGRQADALAALSRFRERLVDELGLDPSPMLRDLERDILQQRPDLDWSGGAVDARPPWSAAVASPRPPGRPPGLPSPPNALVGREADVTSLQTAVEEARLVTVTGPPGVGKTRLGIAGVEAAATGFPGGAYWCELASLPDGSGVAGAIATALGVPRRPGESLESSIATFVADRRVLLALDSCEHVVDAVAGLAEEILRRCGGLTVLATSRAPLRVAGERVVPLAPLPVRQAEEAGESLSPAGRLFADRAAAADPELEVDDRTRPLLEEVCRRVDGLPLAIELLAPRLAVMSLAELRERLDERLVLDAPSRRTRVERHRSLEATVAWSYDLLEERERHLFDRLSVFGGGFTRDAAIAVTAASSRPATVEAGLAGLVEHSLVAADRSAPVTRYRMLEAVRAFGEARLARAGGLAAARRAHGDWALALAEHQGGLVTGPGEPAAVRVLDAELANLRTAHRLATAAGEADRAVRMAVALGEYAYQRLRDEAFIWTEAALALDGAAEHALGPAATASLACGLLNRGERAAATSLAETVLAGCDPSDRASRLAMHALAVCALYEGRLVDAAATAEREKELCVAAGDPYLASFSLLTVSLAHAYGGDVDAALEATRQQRALAERSGSPSVLAWALYSHGEILRSTDPERAIGLLEASITVAREVRNDFVTGVALVSAATIRATTGDPGAALADLLATVEHWRRRGDWAHLWTTVRNVASLLGVLGQDEPASLLLGALRSAPSATPAFGDDRRRLDELASDLGGRLGEDRFEELLRRGGALDPDEAVGVVRDAVAALGGS